MFKSLINLGKDVVDIAVAPVEVAVDITRTVTNPLAKAAKETAKEMKTIIENEDDEC